MAVVVWLMAGIAAPAAVEVIDVAPVWSGHPVQFALLTHQRRQFVAYYDAERQMTVASRSEDDPVWQKHVLPEKIGWDSHNYIALAVDDAGYLHLSGNMHASPLVYFRTRERLDAATFERAPMVGERELKATYPDFFRGPANEYLFTYRDGSSGNGDQLYNVYDTASKTWRRLLDTPLTSGEGLMNAYLNGPSKGPDGRFHLCWVWRDTGACETNHDPCYARSTDLVHWEKANGEPLTLPITLGEADVVDHVPVNGGVINGNVKLGFDSQKRPVVSYHKYDENGFTQIYNARFEDGAWKVCRTSDWDYRWAFSGNGSIPFEIRISGVAVHENGTLTQSYTHPKYGSETWILDEANFKPLGKLEKKSGALPEELQRVQGDFPGLAIQRTNDVGQSTEPGVRYMLQWETLGHNRDKPRPEPLPPPSMLRVIKLKTAD